VGSRLRVGAAKKNGGGTIAMLAAVGVLGYLAFVSVGYARALR